MLLYILIRAFFRRLHLVLALIAALTICLIQHFTGEDRLPDAYVADGPSSFHSVTIDHR